MSKLWLVIDNIITAPFFFLGYAYSAVVTTFAYGARKYQQDRQKAEKGLL